MRKGVQVSCCNNKTGGFQGFPVRRHRRTCRVSHTSEQDSLERHRSWPLLTEVLKPQGSWWKLCLLLCPVPDAPVLPHPTPRSVSVPQLLRAPPWLPGAQPGGFSPSSCTQILCPLQAGSSPSLSTLCFEMAARSYFYIIVFQSVLMLVVVPL